jgi:two-component system chemotaxis response regulator CheB
MQEVENITPRFVVVVGASAGGLHAIIELCAQLNKRMDAAVLIVLHISKMSMAQILMARIQKSTSFTCKVPSEGEKILRHHIYMAPENKHLVVREDQMLLGGGPAESMWRPSIDVLFRSAAASFGNRTIGIILTGLLQDGTAGMQTIKKCGGITIVQDPEEAEYADMPMSVLQNVPVDYSVGLAEMGALLEEKTANGLPPSYPVPPDVLTEAAIAEKVSVGIPIVAQLGTNSLFSCPDCGGGLWEINDGQLTRFRCHIGHSYTARDLALKQADQLEATIWIAVRMMEERRQLLEKMALEERTKGWHQSAIRKEERIGELVTHIERLKYLIFDIEKESAL